MKFHTVSVFAEDNKGGMDNIAFRCFTSLAHKYGFSIQNMRRSGSRLPKRDGKLSTVTNNLGLRWDIESPKKSINNNVAKLLQDSICANEKDIQLIHQFVVAKSEMDNVSRFMFLYNVALQSMDRESQIILDKAILKIEPTCAVSSSRNPHKKNKNKYETIYTRLRNQVAHPRNDTNFGATRKEIESVVDGFQQVVSQMLPRL